MESILMCGKTIGYILNHHLRPKEESEKLLNNAGNQETSAVISEEVRKCCSSIWSLNIPPKIKTFWWRIAHGGIALLDNLRRRGSGQGGLGAQPHFFYGLGPE
ncbi:hypothetical protein YC2023_019304 [Brassica napus]